MYPKDPESANPSLSACEQPSVPFLNTLALLCVPHLQRASPPLPVWLLPPDVPLPVPPLAQCSAELPLAHRPVSKLLSRSRRSIMTWPRTPSRTLPPPPPCPHATSLHVSEHAVSSLERPSFSPLPEATLSFQMWAVSLWRPPWYPKFWVTALSTDLYCLLLWLTHLFRPCLPMKLWAATGLVSVKLTFIFPVQQVETP